MTIETRGTADQNEVDLFVDDNNDHEFDADRVQLGSVVTGVSIGLV